ncbi:LLM class flavin-dependent oxidoreductase [Nonomuraea sp. NPDC050310]|uniref:LLM class flavin-dependent oxidoreductase n=1 Tax=Nonomuraea sp. NPDC050310 TaxID=3154935 RepID=UPI0034015156
MRYGINVAILGGLAEPGRVIEFAQEAERAGWEAMFVWDHLAFAWGVPSADPFVVLAGAARATSRIRLGTAVTPIARHRPEQLAQTVATLDRLSGGRVVLGAGLGGVQAEFTAFGTPYPSGAQLDEALDVLGALLAGEEVRHAGAHYAIDGVRLAPLPVQRPRVPIWIGGTSPAAVRRAERWDGWIIAGDGEDGGMTMTPDRVPGHSGCLALIGTSDPGQSLAAYAEAGVDWWLEHLHERRMDHDALLARIRSGPGQP